MEKVVYSFRKFVQNRILLILFTVILCSFIGYLFHYFISMNIETTSLAFNPYFTTSYGGVLGFVISRN